MSSVSVLVVAIDEAALERDMLRAVGTDLPGGSSVWNKKDD